MLKIVECKSVKRFHFPFRILFINGGGYNELHSVDQSIAFYFFKSSRFFLGSKTYSKCIKASIINRPVARVCLKKYPGYH